MKLLEKETVTNNNNKLASTVKIQEEQIYELKSLLELKSHEQNEYLTASVELQMLREEVRVFRENGNIVRDLQLKNHDLQKQQQELKKSLMESEKKCREMSLQSKCSICFILQSVFIKIFCNI